jgi:tetratricopeptide (TPR) repeat protein
MFPVIISDSIDTPDGWYEQAERAAQSADAADDLSVVSRLCQQGLESGASGESATALRRLAAWAYNRRGELMAEAGNERRALADFQMAIEFDPECSLAIHNRGVSLAQSGKLPEALSDFDRVLELNPGLAVAHRNRAELLASLGRYEEAIRDYDRASVRLNSDSALFRARGLAWQRMGNLDRALADLNESVRLAPSDPQTYAQRGQLAAERGDYSQAKRDLERAIQLDPSHHEAQRSLAWLLATCPDGEFRDARRAVTLAKQALAGPAADHMTLDTLAAAQASSGDFDSAIGTMQRAISVAPEAAGPLLRQRLALYESDQPYVAPQFSPVRQVSHER